MEYQGKRIFSGNTNENIVFNRETIEKWIKLRENSINC